MVFLGGGGWDGENVVLVWGWKGGDRGDNCR